VSTIHHNNLEPNTVLGAVLGAYNIIIGSMTWFSLFEKGLGITAVLIGIIGGLMMIYLNWLKIKAEKKNLEK